MMERITLLVLNFSFVTLFDQIKRQESKEEMI